MFKRHAKKNRETASKKLSTGETNWRLKSSIQSLTQYPNFKDFLKFIESRDDVQIGIGSDFLDSDRNSCCIVRQPVYNLKGTPLLIFSFFHQYVKLLDKIAFQGYTSLIAKPEDLLQIKQEFQAIIPTTRNTDLSMEEYVKFYEECYTQSLTIQGLDPKDYSRIRGNGKECLYKLMERDIRNRFPD